MGGSIFIATKTRVVSIGGHLNAVTYQDETLQPVAIPDHHNVGANPTPQGHPHGARVTTDYPHNEAVERTGCPANSPDLSPSEHLWDHLRHAARDQHNHVGWPATNPGWGTGRHPTAKCDQAGDQHELEVPGCLWIFHPLLRLLILSGKYNLKLPIRLVCSLLPTEMNHPIPKRHNTIDTKHKVPNFCRAWSYHASPTNTTQRH